MNVYTVIIFSTLIGKFCIDTLAEWLNLKSLSPVLPEKLAGLYDAGQYRKSQEYTRTRTRFGLIESVFDLFVLLLFWFSGGFNWLDQIVRSWGLSPIVTGLMFIGILSIAAAMLSLPFDLYSTFVIEERYGFNRTTLRTFILDRIKGLALTLVLGAPVMAIILWFFQTAGDYAWLYCWLIVSGVGFLIQFIAPVWILPLFNKFTPLPEGELRNAILDYAKGVNFSFRDIFVMDGSKRSSKANAFFTGFGKNKRIGLFDTLIAEQSISEIVAVLAHEIGHYKKKHILLMNVVSVLQVGILFFLLSLFISTPGLFEAFHMEQPSIYAGLVFFGLLYESVSFVISIGMNVLSRRHELQADRYAVETIESRENMISALKKLHVQNLSNLTPHPFYVFLNYSHPPLLQRIQGCES